ncbi:UNVERIFIED_CONTAM: hypothetical protein HDU68_002006 [Siphonaria sp. JEL0065]|nr:hypothetical protein HDU68_002006 [Siphonaria sp. JEL0065]
MAGIFKDPIQVLKEHHYPDFEWFQKVYMPVPVNYKQGFESGSFSVVEEAFEETILGVSGHVALVSVDAVKKVGGFHDSFRDAHLALVDACIRLEALEAYFDYDDLYVKPDSIKRKEPEFPREDIDFLFKRHGKRIMKFILNGLWINERITLRYDTIWGDGGCGGWASEILPYIVTLERRIFSVSVPSKEKWCSGMYPYYRDVLDRQRLNPILYPPSSEYPFVYIKHTQGEFAKELTSMEHQHFYLPTNIHFPRRIRPTLLISRTMTETNTVIKNPYFPVGWSKGVDQVWVPAPFLKRVFLESGEIGRFGVKVAKETVDLVRFDPASKRGVVGVWDLRGLRGERWMEWVEKTKRKKLKEGINEEDVDVIESSFATLGKLKNGDEIGVHLKKETKRSEEWLELDEEEFIPKEEDPCHLVFLSVFKWEPRKDPESLLKAFFHTFGLDSGVCLLISTKVSGRGVTPDQVHNHDIIYGEIFKIAANMTFDDAWDPRMLKQARSIEDPNSTWETRLRPSRIPKTLQDIKRLVKVTTKSREWDELPSLYRISDVYVSASHGEGWGLPVHEALAMKIPVIASATSGHLAFLDARNSWPVDLEVDEKTGRPIQMNVPKESLLDFGPNAKWDLVSLFCL